jgi:hypothetical protein
MNDELRGKKEGKVFEKIESRSEVSKHRKMEMKFEGLKGGLLKEIWKKGQVDGKRDRRTKRDAVQAKYPKWEKRKIAGRLERNKEISDREIWMVRNQVTRKKQATQKYPAKYLKFESTHSSYESCFLISSSISVSVCGHCSKSYPSLSNMLHRCYGDKSCHI